MAKINRRFIDKHWAVFIMRGILAIGFGCFVLFNGVMDVNEAIVVIGILLLFMGTIDTVGALYNSAKRHGWFNSTLDALIDVIAALLLLLYPNNDLTFCLIVLSAYVVISGILDIFHGFLSTVDPTDRFIRVLAGVCGCIIGIAILNAGELEITTFLRFFGAYMLIVGTTSLIYGVHNREQDIEDKVARSEAAKKAVRKPAKKSSK